MFSQWKVVESISMYTQGRHALVYDIGSANETWEWVNLSEVYLSTTCLLVFELEILAPLHV